MPIRLNLLAEAQAQEELRRRDPVKRAASVGFLIIILLLVWSSSLQVRKLVVKGELNRLEAQLASRTNAYAQVLENQKKLADVQFKLTSLHDLASARFLQGNVLNALQRTTVEDVQLTRLRTELTCLYTPGSKSVTNSQHKVQLGKPPTVTEKRVLSFDAKDNGATPGDQITKFKTAVETCSYFQDLLGKTNEVRLASLAPPQVGVSGKPFVLFSLECRLPEITR